MKKTFPIRKGQFWELIKNLIHRFGYPSYYRELVIYFQSPNHFKITLTRDGLRWSWADKAFKDRYGRTNHRVKTGLRDLKEKFIFLSSIYGNRGHISVAPVLRFSDKKTKIQVEMRSHSLIGEIVSMIYPEETKKRTTAENFFNKNIRSHLGENLLEKTSGITRAYEEIVLSGISEAPILNTKILDFCRESGIMNPFKNRSTYSEILSAKSNNYSLYEELFSVLTGVRLLSTEKHATLPDKPENDVSIIIPCFDSDATINRVLKSIQYQDIPRSYWEAIEVIIVDDNSGNEVSRLVDINQYPFSIEIIRFSENRGVSHARQIGVTHSRGEILVFIDSDVVLSKHYLGDHIVRNTIIDSAVFVSFKENVSGSDKRISSPSIKSGVGLPKYANDLRIHKKVEKGAIGSHHVGEATEISILESTNFFKDFYGSRVFGVYDLSCMVTGHNFSVKKKLVNATSPFSRMFTGWGMEDVYFGLKMIGDGNFIIPILSCGVFHINHPPRSRSVEKKQKEYAANTEIINSLLDSLVE